MIEAPVLGFGWLTQPSQELEATWDERVYAKNLREFNQLHQILQRVYGLRKPHIPYTMVSEYDGEIKDSVIERRLKPGYVNPSANIKLQSGLASHQMGIVIIDLRDYDTIEKASSAIDEKIRGPLLSGNSLDAYRASTTLHFQYSHDGIDRGGCSDFIKLHHAYIKSRPGNHDLVMVGENREAKLRAIESIKDQLIHDGFERISFYNADTDEETFLYGNESGSGKTYRAIYTSGMSHESFLALLSLSSPLVSVTGDQSLGEAISAKKIICYEVRGHKRLLNEAFYTALKEEARENPLLLKLLELLQFKLEGTDLNDALTLLSDDLLLNQLSLLINHTINKKDLAKNLILDGFGIDLSNPEIVKKLRAGKSIELPDDFRKWFGSEQDLFVMAKQLDKPGSNHSWGDVRKKIVSIFSNQNPAPSFYEEISKVIKDPSTLLVLKEKQLMNYLEQGLDTNADEFLMKERDALLGFIIKNNFTLFLSEQSPMPYVTSKIFLLKIQACLMKEKNGLAYEEEALDLLKLYDSKMQSFYHQIQMTTLYELMSFLKEAPSDAFMKELLLRDGYEELLKIMVAQLEPDEISRLILVFDQEKVPEFLPDSIQESYCLKLTHEGKNSILWDCQMSLKRGAAYDSYAWECYEKAGHPLYTIDGLPFDSYLDSLGNQSKHEYFKTKFSAIHPTGSMDYELDNTSVQITQGMKEKFKELLKEEGEVTPKVKRPREEESEDDDMDLDPAFKHHRSGPPV